MNLTEKYADMFVTLIVCRKICWVPYVNSSASSQQRSLLFAAIHGSHDNH